MSWLSIDVICDTCEERYPTLVDRDERNTPLPCEKCDDGTATRTMSVPNVSTEKTSESIPDAVAKGRFDVHRRQQELRKELSKAKASYAHKPSTEKAGDIKRLRAENKKLKDKK